MSDYCFGVDVAGDFDEIVARVTGALGDEGFGVLTDIDVQATLKAKLGVERPEYRILGACSPPLANRAFDAEPAIGALLPCNVVVRRTEDAIRVEFMDPAAVMTLVDRPDIGDLAAEVKGRLERVQAAL
jgi:uncharacterized protein (DUF302 family)